MCAELDMRWINWDTNDQMWEWDAFHIPWCRDKCVEIETDSCVQKLRTRQVQKVMYRRQRWGSRSYWTMQNRQASVKITRRHRGCRLHQMYHQCTSKGEMQIHASTGNYWTERMHTTMSNPNVLKHRTVYSYSIHLPGNGPDRKLTGTMKQECKRRQLSRSSPRDAPLRLWFNGVGEIPSLSRSEEKSTGDRTHGFAHQISIEELRDTIVIGTITWQRTCNLSRAATVTIQTGWMFRNKRNNRISWRRWTRDVWADLPRSDM